MTRLPLPNLPRHIVVLTSANGPHTVSCGWLDHFSDGTPSHPIDDISDLAKRHEAQHGVAPKVVYLNPETFLQLEGR